MRSGRLPRIAAALAASAMLSACADRTVAGSAQSAPVTSTESFMTRADVPTVAPTTTRPTTTRPTGTALIDIPPEIADALNEAVVDAGDFAGDRPGGWYFTTPSGRFVCGIETSTLTGDLPQVGCQGEIPSTAPRLPAPGAPDNLIPANTILAVGDGEGGFLNAGGVMFAPDSGAPRTLPYGELLVVEGYVCAVDPEFGVTCMTPIAHGFAVSSDTYDTW
ncbi:hypothetical protein [Millisia brevis]|uniref:hypothetical protein n=1 Tax=Millisia brevis TaxID=264148 RepID=UPI000833BA10|nr:hypothetical protein [Millisia brevis]